MFVALQGLVRSNTVCFVTTPVNLYDSLYESVLQRCHDVKMCVETNICDYMRLTEISYPTLSELNDGGPKNGTAGVCFLFPLILFKLTVNFDGFTNFI